MSEHRIDQGVDGLPMFRANARTDDPETSHQAAASISPQKMRESHEAVLALFHERGPMTDAALVECYDGPRQSPSGLRTRRRELADVGLIVDTGERVKLESGRRAIVWGVR